MRGESLKSKVRQHLHRISKPGYYLGGEVNCVVKDTKQVLGRVCLAFTDTHAIGQIHHGLQVLYSIMNNDPRWACERAFTPWFDFEPCWWSNDCHFIHWRHSRRFANA